MPWKFAASAPLGSAVDCGAHELPFQCSASAVLTPALVCWLPTATQLEADGHDTEVSMFSVPVAGFAVVCTTQPVAADAGTAAPATTATAIAATASAPRRRAGAQRRNDRIIFDSFLGLFRLPLVAAQVSATAGTPLPPGNPVYEVALPNLFPLYRYRRDRHRNQSAITGFIAMLAYPLCRAFRTTTS
jgi:hypothetical protein